MKCPASDFIPELTKHYHELWQAELDGCSGNKLYSVKPHLGYSSVIHYSVILRRLRIGHTRATRMKVLMQQPSWILSKKAISTILYSVICLFCCIYIFGKLLTHSINHCVTFNVEYIGNR